MSGFFLNRPIASPGTGSNENRMGAIHRYATLYIKFRVESSITLQCFPLKNVIFTGDCVLHISLIILPLHLMF